MSIVDRPNADTATGPMPVANMWCAHTPQPRKPIAMPGEHDDRVAEQRLAREHRKDLGDDAHAREDEDVHLGMAEDPEQVLVHQRIAAGGRVEEVRVEVAVHEDHDQRRGDAAASRTA